MSLMSCDKQQLTIHELLAMEQLAGGKVLAGWGGRDNPVQAVRLIHLLEADDTVVASHTLILHNCGENGLPEEKTGWFLKWCAKKKVSGLAILGSKPVALTPPVCALADKLKLPIIQFSDCSRQDIVEALELAMLLKEKGKLLEYVNGSSRRFLRVIGEGGGLVQLARVLADTVNNPVVFADSAFRPLAMCGIDLEKVGQVLAVSLQDAGKRSPTGSLFGSEVTRVARQGHILLNGKEEVPCILIPLIVEGINYGYVVAMEQNQPLNHLDMVRVGQAGRVAVVELMKQRALQETERKYKTDFVYDVLYNNFESREVLISRGKLWGWDFTKGQGVMVLEVDDFQTLRGKGLGMDQLVSLISLLASQRYANPVVVEKSDQVVLILPHSNEGTRLEQQQKLRDLAEMLKAKVKQNFAGLTLSIGIGRIYPSATEIYRSYQEAKIALELGRFTQSEEATTFFDELGVVRLLYNLNHQQLDEFCHELLGQLLQYDEENGTNMVETLHHYLQSSGDYNATAEALYLHPNTLRYRIKKIEEILDTDLSDFESQLNLSVALKILVMRRHGFGAIFPE